MLPADAADPQPDDLVAALPAEQPSQRDGADELHRVTGAARDRGEVAGLDVQPGPQQLGPDVVGDDPRVRADQRPPRPARATGPGAAAATPQLKVYHKLLSSPGMRHEDLGPDYYERRASTRRQIAHHAGKLAGLGFEVTLARLPGAAPDPSEVANTQTP